MSNVMSQLISQAQRDNYIPEKKKQNQIFLRFMLYVQKNKIGKRKKKLFAILIETDITVQRSKD